MVPVYLLLLSLCTAFSLDKFSFEWLSNSLSLDIAKFFTPSEIPGNSPFELCELEEEHKLNIKEIVVEPYPPIPGENLTVDASGELLVTVIDGAYVDVVVTYGFIILINKRYDLCELVPEVDLECPVQKGLLSLSKTVEIPAEVPPGEYTVQARAYNADDTLLSCLTATIDIET